MAATIHQFRNPTKGARKNFAYRVLDGRSAEGHLLRKMRDQLLGGLPQPIPPLAAALAERAAFVQLNLLKLDAIALNTKRGMSPSQSRMYASLSTQHSRLIKELARLTPLAPPGAELDQYLASYESAEGAVA
jgi:hypothetical protein